MQNSAEEGQDRRALSVLAIPGRMVISANIVTGPNNEFATLEDNVDVIPIPAANDTDSFLTGLVTRHTETQTGLLQIASGVIAEPSLSLLDLLLANAKLKCQFQLTPQLLIPATRSNKYDGFCTSSLYEARPCKTKVKAHVIPSAASNPSTGDPIMQVQNDDIPPPTTIATMQAIGTHLCAIPEEELTSATLTEDRAGSSCSSSYSSFA